MPISFLPKLMTTYLTDINPSDLQQRGISLLMMDFDNTMLPYTSNEPPQQLLHWISEMKQGGITLCVVSNSRKNRVPEFCRKNEIACVTRALKPLSKGITCCMREFQKKPEQCAIVGDQIYTDILGGNCSSVCSILVKPIHLHNIWLKLRHAAEMPFIFAARKRRLNHEKS